MGMISYFIKYGVYGVLFKAAVIGAIGIGGFALYKSYAPKISGDKRVEQKGSIDDVVNEQQRVIEMLRRNDIKKGGEFKY